MPGYCVVRPKSWEARMKLQDLERVRSVRVQQWRGRWRRVEKDSTEESTLDKRGWGVRLFTYLHVPSLQLVLCLPRSLVQGIRIIITCVVSCKLHKKKKKHLFSGIRYTLIDSVWRPNLGSSSLGMAYIWRSLSVCILLPLLFFFLER